MGGMVDARALLRESRDILAAARADLEECHRIQETLAQRSAGGRPEAGTGGSGQVSPGAACTAGDQVDQVDQVGAMSPNAQRKRERLLQKKREAAAPAVVAAPMVLPPPPPSTPPPPMPEGSSSSSSSVDPEEQVERRPRVASEALAGERQIYSKQNSGGSTSSSSSSSLEDDHGLGLDGDESDEEREAISSGLNVNHAEDQVGKSGEDRPAEDAAAAYDAVGSPRTTRGLRALLPSVSETDALDFDDYELLLPPPNKQQLLRAGMSMRTLRRASEVKVGAGDADPEVAALDSEGAAGVAELELSAMDKSGTLLKLPSTDKIFARAHPRFFVLRGQQLWYQTSAQSKQVGRMISLRGARCEAYRRKHSDPPVLEMFVTPRNDKHLRVQSKSQAEIEQWRDAIQNNIDWSRQLEALEIAKKKRATRRTSHLGIDISERPSDSELPKTYYEELGVPPDASQKQIKRTYLKLARGLHPDKNPDIDPAAFARINEAHDVLSKEDRRAAYDLCETVKAALRLGVLASMHGGGGGGDGSDDDPPEPEPVTLFLDRNYESLFYQSQEFGSVLRPGYARLKLQHVGHIYACEDAPPGVNPAAAVMDDDTKRLSIAVRVTKAGTDLGFKSIALTLDTPEARDDVLDGMRILRCMASMLFQQELDKMKEKGFR